MKQKWIRLVAIVTLVAVLLTGCGVESLDELFQDIYSALMLGTATSFEDMEYVRPDLDSFEQILEECMALAETETDVDKLMDCVYGVYECYYDFYTNYSLANIRYCQNVTDIFWNEEYEWCLQGASQIDAGMDQLLYALADCPLRQELEDDAYFGEGFFDAYDGQSIWDDTFTALMNQEAQLLAQYYELDALGSEAPYYSEEFFSGYGYEIEKVFAELVKVRQEIAAYAGYEDYGSFAYEFYFYRDYTPEQAEEYLQEIARELTPLYLALDSSAWEEMYTLCTTEEVYAYLTQCVNAVGGLTGDALALMEKAGLYDITYSDNKYGTSFETFLYSYYEPFIFVCPTGYSTDKLTFVHEFGHFCNDYAMGGTVVGVDVAEVFSQGLEYLSLCYCDNTEGLTRGKMADSLCVFVEQAAYAAFELEVYQLEDVTVENVRAVYEVVFEQFGLEEYGRDSRDYVLIPHFFIAPMYVISYVVSNDIAMQIYEAELDQAGSGVTLWEDGLFTMQVGLLGFVEEMKLTSPFEEGRVAQIRETFEKALG